jgi:hypothetical protein
MDLVVSDGALSLASQASITTVNGLDAVIAGPVSLTTEAVIQVGGAAMVEVGAGDFSMGSRALFSAAGPVSMLPLRLGCWLQQALFPPRQYTTLRSSPNWVLMGHYALQQVLRHWLLQLPTTMWWCRRQQ